MDATRFLGLTRLLPVAMVWLLTTAPTLRAEESSTLVFTDPDLSDGVVEESEPAQPATSVVVVPAAKSQGISQPQRLQTASPRPAAHQAAAHATARSARPATRQRTPEPDRRVQQLSYEQPLPARDEPEPADPVAETLIEAHELSQQAATEEDYADIIALCKSAQRMGARGEPLEFARSLTAWALNRRGQARVDQGEQALADADFEQALRFDPSNWRALHNRGVSSAQTGRFADALDDFNRVIELNPLFAKAFVNRATLFAQSGDLEVALADYQRACRLDPKLLVAQVGSGRTLHLLGRREEALDAFNKALELEPDSAEIVCSRADLLTDLGRYGEALADYARSIDLDPEFAHAYRNGAWLLATCPDPRYRDGENAVRGAEQALEFGYGERHVALDTLAAAQASAGEFDQAIQTLQEAIKLAPYQARKVYFARLKDYEAGTAFLMQPPRDVQQAVYETTDR